MKEKNKLQFNIIFRPEEEGGFTAIVPSLPGCITYGKDLKEAKKMAIDAIYGYIESVKKHKEEIQSDEESFISLIRLPQKHSRLYA
ncbi:MAG: type II toxin-antitoxin system HicB family antitoxin [Patescibacteria group bacterium]